MGTFQDIKDKAHWGQKVVREISRQSIQATVADIPASYSRLIARELGLSARQLPVLLRGTGVDSEQFLRNDALLTVPQQTQIIRNALSLSGKPDFGLQLGSRLTPATHGAMGFAASSSPNLLSALQAFHNFLPVRASFIQLHLQEAGGRLECLFNFQLPLEENVERLLAEAVAKAFFEMSEFIVGRPITEAETFFSHQAPTYLAKYADSFPGLLHFGCEQLKITMPMELCQVKNALSNNDNYHLALQQCQEMLSKLNEHSSNIVKRLKLMMLSRPPGTLTEEEAAAVLFVCKRTLARKLKSEGTSFRKVREDILSTQAAAYLKDTKLTVESIASLLNYHDSSSFRRAFKRWFGLTPDQYRQEFGLS